MEIYCGEAMNSLREAQRTVDSESRNYWNAVDHAVELMRTDNVSEQDAIAQAAEKFGLSGDELLPMPEAIDNLIREQIDQEHQSSDDIEP